jgi:serine/threonine protein kinase
LKVQRVPLEPDSAADLPEPRFEDGPPLRHEDQVDIRERTAREIEIFQRCRDLQGTILPRLYGLVSPEDYPRSSAPKLMLQHLDAEPVGRSDYMWRCIWGDFIQQAVKEAFSKLHARRVCHRDVSTSNILVEWRRKASGSSATRRLGTAKLRELVQQAQDQMQLSRREFTTAARKSGEYAGVDADGDSGLALEVSESPINRLRDAIKPHIWLIDFAGSVVVEEGSHGDSLLTSEAGKVKETMDEWARER